MEWKVIGDKKDTILKTILGNRGIKEEDAENFINSSVKDTHNYSLLFDTKEEANNFLYARYTIEYGIRKKIPFYIIVDSDCDGFTSAAELHNYLTRTFGEEFLELIHLVFHNGKQHGIELDKLPKDTDFILIIPDAGSNDISQCKYLYERNIPVIILDHHEVEEFNPYCILINNQTGQYPNSQISGVGVVYKFIQYLDEVYLNNFADDYLDLVSLGMISDMMTLNNPETKYFVTEGCSRILNPFISHHVQENIKRIKTPNSVSFGFYVSPYINAMCRSGEKEEKELLFNCMLDSKANDKIVSNGKNTKGEEVPLWQEALRVAKNVKARQDKIKKEKLLELSNKIYRENLQENGAIIILNDSIDFANIAGLVCNEIISKFQRPAMCLTQTKEGNYEGSVRGYPSIGIEDFKEFVKKSELTNWQQGHGNAFGVSIPKTNIEDFIKYCNDNIEIGRNIYYVDYELNQKPSDYDVIKSIAEIPPIWGNGLSEPLVVLKGISVSFEMIRVFSKKKEDEEYITVKITLQNGIDVMIFGVTKHQLDILPNSFKNPVKKLDFIGRCSKNVFKGKVTYQILVDDFDISKKEETIVFRF